MATVEEMLAEQNQGFGLDAVTGVTTSGDHVSWESGIARVWQEIGAPYARLKLGLTGDATKAKTPTGSYRDGQTAATAKQKTEWLMYGLIAVVAVGAVLLARR